MSLHTVVRWICGQRDSRDTSARAAHLRTGEWGERVAVEALRKRGYKVLGQRIRVGRHDELDIIARQGATLVFVEVKTRASERMGRPIESVTRAKRQRVSRAAMRYMGKLKKKPPYFRFDVVEVIGTEGEAPPEVRHIENVFTLPSSYKIGW